MTRIEISRHLRPLRRELVLAAEKALTTAYAKGEQAFPPSKTQFSRLVNLCNEASCAEELENYLRYQAGRKSTGRKGEAWNVPFVEILLAEIHGVLGPRPELGGPDLAQRDLHRVEAWRLYATYLARAFTYENAKRDVASSGSKTHQNNQGRDQGHHDHRKHRNHS